MLTSMSPLVLHIPHASQHIPCELRSQFILNDEELQLELLRMTDHYTDELFALDGAQQCCTTVSRLILDVERFEDDAQEEMSQIGMGVIYTQTSQLTALRHHIDKEEREGLIQAYYRPHHEKLTQCCADALVQHGKCLIIDCHSFPTHSLPYELKIHDEQPRPEICIGTDDYHSAPALTESCCQAFRDLGYEVALNAPFAGSLVPMPFYQQNPRVQSLMIELRRDLYMDETSGLKNAHFNKLKQDINTVLRRISN